MDVLVLDGERTSIVLAEPYNEHSPTFSPNGRWLAYVSNESSQDEIYVRPYPGPGGSKRVSLDGGDQPVWSPDPGELFYRIGDSIMVVPFETTATEVRLGTARKLFSGRYYRGNFGGGRSYDVAPDGRFLMLQLPEAEFTQINVVLNWFEELKRLVPTESD